jgi:hypothetical protein
MIKVSKLVAPLAITLTLASPAFAACDQARLHVVRSEGPYAGGLFFYDLAPATVLPTFYYRYSTNNPQLITQLDSAWVGRFTVRAVGNAAGCGTAGTVRSGGTLTFVYRDSFF